MVMAVSFTRYGRLYYLDPGGHDVRVGDTVLVPTDSEPEVAECVWAPQWVSEDIGGLPVCAGPATAEHLARAERNRSRRTAARSVAKRLIRVHDLPMKVVGVDYLDGDEKIVIYFSAPHRIDFRDLVRALAGELRARIDLRQLGPRDEARVQGGIGPCGRDLCCASFLKDFEPVSMRMVKDQDLPLNPLKISGACGGAIVTGSVFGLPGLGQLAVASVTNQDLPVIIGIVLVASVFIIVANIFVDAAYAVLDPRVRLG
jgi:cell fate regulator YaaT (PSP1 superfamily)